MTNFINENQLDDWVRGNARDAQGLIVELVWRLVAASSPRPRERRFPLGDSIGQHGPDGVLIAEIPYEPFVPEGRSFWEIGTGIDAGSKATSDYRDLTDVTPIEIRNESTFVFVTPLSGRRGWDHSWNEDAQAKWLETRRKKNEWFDVRVIDGTKLIDWLRQFPTVAMWVAEKTIGLPPWQIETLEQRWSLVGSVGEPPPLVPDVFLANRNEASSKLAELFADTTVQLRLETHHPDQACDFISAYVAQLPQEQKLEALGRAVIVSGQEGWSAFVNQRERHVLIADGPLDLSGAQGTKMIQSARKAGHAVVFAAPPGGIPDPSTVRLVSPRASQLQEALVSAGYKEERARTLVQKSGANLGSLLRCIQNLSLLPDWAEDTVAAELAIAAALGEWNEKSPADMAVVETIAGKSYGEWIQEMRDAAARPSTPLTQWEGQWKFVPRYEGWYALGPRLFDDQVERLRACAVTVLSEADPKFGLEQDKRYAAAIYGMRPKYSANLRSGLANFLAIVGNHHQALTSTSRNSSRAAAITGVREILDGADWMRWASLNDYLPLLAEAAPDEFLTLVEQSLSEPVSPIDELFRQEGDGMFGGSLISGLLWSLETLAWEPERLTRVVLCLGELSSRDPGGTFTNRPANSISTILLPWLPQTTANVDARRAAVCALLEEHSAVGWKALLSLLPSSHSTSSGSRRPAWRESIPNDWTKGVSRAEYWSQIDKYAELAIGEAANDYSRTVALIEIVDALPDTAFTDFTVRLGGDGLSAFSIDQRASVWSAIAQVAAKHRRFADAEWAMTDERVRSLEALVKDLEPSTADQASRRLFNANSWDLLDGEGSYEDQNQRLSELRARAISDIRNEGGLDAVVAFSTNVASPSAVGESLAIDASKKVDQSLLPDLVGNEDPSIAQFVGGYVWGRFRASSWSWVDETLASSWKPQEIAEFLTFLPFEFNAWQRAQQLLGADEYLYWKKASAHFFYSSEEPQLGIKKLLEYGRPAAALRGLYVMTHEKKKISPDLAIQALLNLLDVPGDAASLNSYEISQVIQSLQESPEDRVEDVARVEWAYVPILNKRDGVTPKILEKRLAEDPRFYCELVRLVYRSTNESTKPEPSEHQKSIASNAYQLLSHWSLPPGLKGDGSFDGDLFTVWLDQVKEESESTGHFEVAMSTLGHVLLSVPSEPTRLWIHNSVGKALNAKDAEALRRGYELALYNSRGAHWVDPTGAPERELAARYRERATQADSVGYHRLAQTMNHLADSYVLDAQRIVDRAERED